MRHSLGEFNLRAPLRNMITRSCFPTDLPSKVSWFAAIVATYTLSVDADRPSRGKENTDPMPQLRGSFPWEENQFTKMRHFRSYSHLIEGALNPSPLSENQILFGKYGATNKISSLVPWPVLHILLANFIGLFSIMSEVSGLPRVTPSVSLLYNAEMTDRTGTNFMFLERKLCLESHKL